jgi:CubicO group peptidase (beta-lactamase class C family)
MPPHLLTFLVPVLEPIRQKYQLPALAGAIVSDHGMVAFGAVGVRKAGTSIRVTTRDKWHLGSDTKAMTATIVASLVEQGRLTWDTQLEQIFPDLTPAMSPDMRRVTLLHLLSHRAGLPHDIDWQAALRRGTVQERRQAVVRVAGALRPRTKPGTTFEYSNVGYVIAGAMVERITGESWEGVMKRRLFGPLGMATAGFGGLGTPGQIDQPWPHGANGAPTERNGPAVDNPKVMGPAGTVHSSLADWAKFVADHLRGERGQGALLHVETYRRLHTPPFGGDYALGWLVAERAWGGGPVLTHAGSNTMNYAVVWIAPKRNFAVLVCTNQNGDVAKRGTDEAAAALIRYHVHS